MWLSARLAAHVQAALLQHTGMTDRGVRQAQFRVLRGARMPAIVAELGFLTHASEGKEVFGAARRAAVVRGLVEGLERFDAAQHASVYR
jgi:N-acetylmuramoyl-L-alanine amidase